MLMFQCHSMQYPPLASCVKKRLRCGPGFRCKTCSNIVDNVPGTQQHTSWTTWDSHNFWSAYKVYLRNYPAYTFCFYIFCSVIPVLLNSTCFVQLRAGEMKHTRIKRNPITRGKIKPSMNHNLHKWSSKRLQLINVGSESTLICV